MQLEVFDEVSVLQQLLVVVVECKPARHVRKALRRDGDIDVEFASTSAQYFGSSRHARCCERTLMRGASRSAGLEREGREGGGGGGGEGERRNRSSQCFQN